MIKIKDDQRYIKDIWEVLENLEETNMKLNPKKCIYGVEERRFLGYVVTPTKVRVNPKKIKSILKTKTPSMVNEIQSLTGKMAALGHFLTMSVKKYIFLFPGY